MSTSERGAGLVLSLMTLAVLGLLSVTVYQMARSLVRESVYQLRQTQAQAIAEAGLEDALQQLRRNEGWRAGFNRKPFAQGTYTVRISTGSPPWVTSTGYSKPIFLLGPAVKSVRVQTLILRGDDSLAIQADEIMIRPGAFIDATSGDADVWANGLLTVSALATVSGRGYYAGRADVSGAIVNGVQRSTFTRQSAQMAFSGLSEAGKISLTPGCAFNPKTRDLDLSDPGCRATLPPGLYFLHDVRISSGALVAANSDGPVAIFFDGNFYVGPLGQLRNETASPLQLALYGQTAGKRLQLNSVSPIQADISAPLADIEISPSQVLIGRLVGKRVDLGGTLHYDHTLGGAAKHVGWLAGSWMESFSRQ